MTQAVQTAQNVAQMIPAKVRAVIYTVLGTLTLLEAIWDFLPEIAEGKVLKTLNVIGFGIALGNTGQPPAQVLAVPAAVVENIEDAPAALETPDGPYPGPGRDAGVLSTQDIIVVVAICIIVAALFWVLVIR